MSHSSHHFSPKKIMLVVDSRALFARATVTESLQRVSRLAIDRGASVTLCDVVEALPREIEDETVAQRLQLLRQRFAEEYLSSLSQQLEGLVPGSVEVLSGTPFIAITRKVMKENYDLVIHITERPNSSGGFDADDMHLVRKCPCPVWMIDALNERPHRNIVVAVDRDIFESDGAASGFAHHLGLIAQTLAQTEQADLHVVHAWQPFGADLLDDPSLQIDAATREQYIATQQANHAVWLNELQQALSSHSELKTTGTEVQIHLLEGHPEKVVPEFIDEMDADLLVMGTVGVTTVPGQFIGNTAERILNATRVSVLAIKPPSFVSPLAVADTRQSA